MPHDDHIPALPDGADEILALRLISWHNLRFLLHLMEEVRAAIEQDCYGDFVEEFYKHHVRGNW